MTTSPSLRVRPSWPELPSEVRAAIEERLGAEVLEWTSHDGGYTPGLASTVRTAAGKVFVKAVPAHHEFAAHAYREEARRSGMLPTGVPAPRLRWHLDVDDVDGAWIAVAFDAVEGRTPATPLAGDELTAVVRLAAEIAEHEIGPGTLPAAVEALPTRSTQDLADRRPAGLGSFDPWFAAQLDRLAEIEQGVTAAVAGNRLVHGDLRGDNTLLVASAGEPERAVAVDWPFAARGAAFCDLVLMLPAVHAEGGPPPDEVLSWGLPPGAADDDAIDAFLAAIAGYFVDASMQPPPPAAPGVRELQRAQGEVCIGWLRHRLG